MTTTYMLIPEGHTSGPSFTCRSREELEEHVSELLRANPHVSRGFILRLFGREYKDAGDFSRFCGRTVVTLD